MLATICASFVLAAPTLPEPPAPQRLRFDPLEIESIAPGGALPSAFDDLGARGLRLASSTVVPARGRARHLLLEHPSHPGRNASLLLHDGRLTGAIYLDGGLRVSLTGLAPGESSRSVDDGARELPCAEGELLPDPSDVGSTRTGMGPDGGVAGGCDPGTRTDVLVRYTEAARVQAGGETQIQDWILWAIADSNAIYSASNIPLSLRLVGTSLAQGYVEDAASMANDLYLLTDPADGVLDDTLALRDSRGADLVALVRADGGGACGIAWLVGGDPAQESYGYSVTALGCFTNRTFTHELGHNMGCCHAPGDGGGCVSGGYYPYSTGHRFTGVSGSQYRTVMAYAPGTRIGRFSSPLQLFDGVPTGIADARDNARSIGITRLAFSNFRCSVCPTDINADGVRDGADLTLLLAGFGTSAPDLDGDGTVTGSDLALLINDWGPCP